MRTNIFLIVTVFLGIWLVPSLIAKDELPGEIRFEHVGVAEGLSSSSVSKIIQDRQGLLWFATQSGLNRYDGYTFDRYEHNPFNRNSLSHNLIQTMYYEEPDTLWIGTYGGLNHFDLKNESFKWYTHQADSPATLSNNVVVDIVRSASGDLWVGTLKGLNRYDEENQQFTRYMQGDPQKGQLPNDVIRSLAVDSQGTLWVGTYGGLLRYNGPNDSFEICAPHGEKNGLPSPYVMYILPDPQESDVLWVGTWDGGVSKVNTDTEEVTTYTLPHNEIYTMMFDSHGRLWAGTWGNGLYVVDPSNGSYSNVTTSSNELMEKLSNKVIYSLLEDSSGIIWIGTNGGGVYKYVPWENSYRAFVHEPENESTISEGKITAVYFDEDGTGWFGTYNGGLNRYNMDTESFNNYTHDPDNPQSLSNNIVNDIFRDSEGNLWIGTNEGLNRYRPGPDSFERIYAASDEYTPPEDVVFEITEGPSGSLWLGTNTSGVAIYNHKTGKYKVLSHDPDDPHSLSDNLIRSILHDSTGMVWVGTNDGLNRYNRETGRFVRYFHDTDRPGSTISGDNIREIHEDTQGRIWIATMGGGVSLYDRESDSFSYITAEDGLVSNHVLGILQDKDGKLWFPTNRGISIYDPEEGDFRTINEANGLLSNELTKASVQGPDGSFYFGSAKGVSIIDDINRSDPDYVPQIAITEFTVLGESKEITQEKPGTYKKIDLDYTDSFFSFEFSVLDYASPEQNKYAYVLEGFDDGWKYSERNFISYTNLDPGKYTLRIRGAGSRGNWNKEGISIPIDVQPPWWQANFAYFGYTLLALLAFLLGYYWFRKRRLEAEAQIAEKERINKELDQKVRERTAEIEKSRALAEEATKAKTLFLANMSHEIRTPLNGLIGMLSLLSKTPLKKDQQGYLEYSKISAETLNTLVNDLLDFERIEAGELKLAHGPFSLNEVADYMQRLFHSTCKEKGLVLNIEVFLQNAPDVVVGDRNRVVQILTNLLSNAVKYTNEGKVTLRITSEVNIDTEKDREGNATYAFEIEDTGIGIAEENLKTIFDHFKQIENGYTKTSRGVGLGLAIVKQVTQAMEGDLSVHSRLGKGSLFRIELSFPPAEEEQRAAITAQAEAAKESEAETKMEHGAESQAATEEVQKTHEHNKKILVCEDEGINRLYITQYLKRLGYTTDVAADGLQAVSKAQENEYGVILMDLGMPHISGLEAAKRIRRWEQENQKEEKPIIALTAHTYEDDVQKCYEAGMNDFISKPIKELDLKQMIEKWLG